MRRYFYEANPIIKKWLENQYHLTRIQDDYFKNALLTSIKLALAQNKSQKTLSQDRINTLRQYILDMTIQQQYKYANNMHIECLFTHLQTIHRVTRGKNMIIKGTKSNIKDLVDPDKFPVFDLKKAKNMFFSVWEEIQGTLRYQMGHQLIIGDSLVEHPSGGRGVFIVLKKNKHKILPGDFLGFVPGIIYDSYNSYSKLRLESLNQYEKMPQHLHFPSNKVLQLSDIPFGHQLKQQLQIQKLPKIQPQHINPYSLGHMINHPPVDKQANVFFSEIELPYNFLPEYLKNRRLPYYSYLPLLKDKKDKKLIVFGIFASKQINNYEQLYVNYCQNHIYPIQQFPEWMIQPIQNSYANFIKGEYQNSSTSYWQWVERKALQKNNQLYLKYRSIIRRTPGKVIHEDSDRVIKQMNINNNT